MTNETPLDQILHLERNPFKSFTRSFKEWFSKKDWNRIIENSSIIILLVAFGVLVRLLFAYYYRMNFSGSTEEIIWNYIVDFNPNYKPFTGYSDFDFYYYSWVNYWYKDNWYPFTNWWETVSGDAWYYYSYPPIFLYFIVSIWRPGMTNLWIAMPMIIADAACAGVVFLIIDEIFKQKKAIAFLGGMLMVLAPINVIYDGVYWLNPGPVTLLTLISFYFVTKRKWWQAFFWLAIATMTKQNALFLTYPMFMVMLGEKVQKKGAKKATIEGVFYIVFFIFTCLVISLPWVLITPIQYGAHMFYPGKNLALNPSVEEPAIGQPTNFSWALYFYGIQGFILDFVAFGINSMLFMILTASVIVIYLLWRSYYSKMDNIELFEFIAIYMILTHIFMPRGVFKFYSAYYVPFILIAFLGSLFYYKEKLLKPLTITLIVGLFVGFNIWHQLCNPYFLPVLLFICSIILLVFNIVRQYYKKYEIKIQEQMNSQHFN